MLTVFRKHPNGAFHLVIIELMERFSYYSFQALIILYLTNKLSIHDEQAYLLVGVFVSLTYAAPVIGGYIADNHLGLKLSIVLGMLFLTLGYFCLFSSNSFFFYSSLVLQVLGNALFKGNMNGLFGSLYNRDKTLREEGFTLFFTGINLGSMLSAVTGAYIAHIYGWEYAFMLSGMVMAAAMFIFSFYFRNDLHLEVNQLVKSQSLMKFSLFAAGVTCFIIAILILLLNLILTNVLLLVIAVILLGTTVYKAINASSNNKRRLYLLLFVLLISLLFQALYQQAFMSLTIFTERNVDRVVFGYIIPTAMFQSINPFFVIMLSIIMMKISGYFPNRDGDATLGIKLVVAMVIMALGFWVLDLGIANANTAGYSAIGWLAISYLLQAVAELLFIPISYSLIASLSPINLLGLTMGFWSFSQAIANILASYISNFTVISSDTTNPLTTNALYAQVFFYIGVSALLIAAVILYIAKKYLNEGISIDTSDEVESLLSDI